MRDRLRDLLIVDVTVIRCVQRKPEAVGVAGFGEQFLRALDIIGLEFERTAVAEQAFGHQSPGGNRSTFHHAFDQRLTVDGFGNRAPHTQVFERIFLQRLARFIGDKRRTLAITVQMQIHQPVRNRAVECEIAAFGDARNIRGGHVFNRAYIARQQCRHPCGIGSDNAQRHFIPRGFGAPIGVVARKFHAVALGVAHELERPGADGGFAAVEILGRRTLGGARGDDES